MTMTDDQTSNEQSLNERTSRIWIATRVRDIYKQLAKLAILLKAAQLLISVIALSALIISSLHLPIQEFSNYVIAGIIYEYIEWRNELFDFAYAVLGPLFQFIGLHFLLEWFDVTEWAEDALVVYSLFGFSLFASSTHPWYLKLAIAIFWPLVLLYILDSPAARLKATALLRTPYSSGNSVHQTDWREYVFPWEERRLAEIRKTKMKIDRPWGVHLAGMVVSSLILLAGAFAEVHYDWKIPNF